MRGASLCKRLSFFLLRAGQLCKRAKAPWGPLPLFGYLPPPKVSWSSSRAFLFFQRDLLIWLPDRSLPGRHSVKILALCSSPVHLRTKQGRAELAPSMRAPNLSAQGQRPQLGTAEASRTRRKVPAPHSSPAPLTSAVLQRPSGSTSVWGAGCVLR